MASLRRRPDEGAGGRRSRSPAASEVGTEPSLPLGRRVGVLVIVATLAMSVMLASGGGPGGPAPTSPPATGPPGAGVAAATPRGSAPLPPDVVPVITPPEVALVRDKEWTAQVTIPDPGVPLRSLELRILRNDRRATTVRVRSLVMSVRGISLRQGENRLEAALVNDGGEGPRSEAVVVTLDSIAPRIELREPDEGETVDNPLVTVRGATEAGTQLTISNETSGSQQSVTADARGIFDGELRLVEDRNVLSVRAVDAAGNASQQRVTVLRGDIRPEAQLSLSRRMFKLTDLPADFDIRVVVRNASGGHIDGASVTFIVAQPGLEAQLHDTVTRDGVAEWKGAHLPRAGAIADTGFVTVEVRLPNGLVSLTDRKEFTIGS